MGALYILLIIFSVLMEYEFIASLQILPLYYIQIIKYPSLVFGVASAVALKWFLPLGILGIVFGILGLTIWKKEDDDKVRGLVVIMTIIYGLALLIGIL